LSIKASAAYTNARLTKDYFIEADRWETSPVARAAIAGSAKTSAGRRNYDRQYFSGTG